LSSYPAGGFPTNNNSLEQETEKKRSTCVAVMMMIRQPEQQLEITHYRVSVFTGSS
jgi:hypothetical protein